MAALHQIIDITAEDLRKRPWKHIGYKGFSRFISSDNDFFILRRFSTITARVLLALQDEIVELECKLADLDESLSRMDAPHVHNGSFRQESSTARLEVLRSLDPKLRAYNELALQHSQLRHRPEVPSKDINSIAIWFQNKPKAILDEEAQYMQKTDDLFAMVPKTKSPLRDSSSGPHISVSSGSGDRTSLILTKMCITRRIGESMLSSPSFSQYLVLPCSSRRYGSLRISPRCAD
jgi:hypothetical protein